MPLPESDPLVLVQSVTSMNGFEAWGKLHRRYNPVTPARALQAMIFVMVPSKVKDPKEIPAEIEKMGSQGTESTSRVRRELVRAYEDCRNHVHVQY